MMPSLSVPETVSASQSSPLGKRNVNVAPPSLLATPGSPFKRRSTPQSSRESGTATPAVDYSKLRETVIAPSPLRSDVGQKNQEEDPVAAAEARSKQAAEAIDNILTMVFELDREIKEAEEDLKGPGEVARLAERKVRRGHRKSKELEGKFLSLAGGILEDVFRQFDTDSSGQLDEGELKAAFEAAGRPADDDTIRRAIKALDTNHDGVIDLQEFKAIAWKCATF